MVCGVLLFERLHRAGHSVRPAELLEVKYAASHLQQRSGSLGAWRKKGGHRITEAIRVLVVAGAQQREYLAVAIARVLGASEEVSQVGSRFLGFAQDDEDHELVDDGFTLSVGVCADSRPHSVARLAGVFPDGQLAQSALPTDELVAEFARRIPTGGTCALPPHSRERMRAVAARQRREAE